jgi:hypothetical protein
MITRRTLLSTLGSWSALGALSSSSLLPSFGYGFGQQEKVGIHLLDVGQGAHARPRAVEQLMWEVSKRSSIDIREGPLWIKPEDANLYTAPFLVWLGLGHCPILSDEVCQKLNVYLRAGGFLFIDDLSPPGDDRFDQSVRTQIKRIWPESSLSRVSTDHTIYRSFFLLDRPHGRIQRAPYLEHIRFDDLSPILYGRNDTFGAFGRTPSGQWKLPVIPGGHIQREEAFRFGINLVMYATCLNYKRDQVHTLTILRRRKWKAQ